MRRRVFASAQGLQQLPWAFGDTALQWGGGHLAGWCCGVGVEGGLASRWGGGKRQVGVSRPCAVEFLRLHRGLQQLTWALGDTALQWGGTT